MPPQFTRGYGLVFGHGAVDLATASPQQVRALRRRDIAYVSQFLRALPRVAALDVVAERAIEADDNGEPSDELDAEPVHAPRAREQAMALISLMDHTPASASGRRSSMRASTAPARQAGPTRSSSASCSSRWPRTTTPRPRMWTRRSNSVRR